MEDFHQLVARFEARDIAAFEKFYKHYYKKLYITAYRYTREHEQSEEIVHDLFLKIWAKGPQLKITSLDSYLYRSVINSSLNFIKKQKRSAEKHENFIVGFEETETLSDDQEKLEDRLKLIEKALCQLPPQCKKVMIMSKYDKYKQQDIADSLDISIKTVKNHITYGYKKIREFLMDNNAFFCF